MRTALYRLYSEVDVLLYIGITAAPRSRWAAHASRSEWWPDVHRKEIQWYESRAEAEIVEIAAIRSQRPVHNIRDSEWFATPRADKSGVDYTRRPAKRPDGRKWPVSRIRFTPPNSKGVQGVIQPSGVAGGMSLNIVGAVEIAARAAEHGVTIRRETVNQWNYRRKAWEAEGKPQRRQGEETMPAPLGTVSGQPAWDWDEVLAWMIRTKKIKPADA